MLTTRTLRREPIKAITRPATPMRKGRLHHIYNVPKLVAVAISYALIPHVLRLENPVANHYANA